MTIALAPPTIETDLRREYTLPAPPPDDITALRERCSPHDVWERSRVTPTHWFNARTGTMRGWHDLVSQVKGGLREHYLPAPTVWVVRSDEIIPPQVHGIYSNEAAAISAAGGDHGRRVHPWQVLDRPVLEHTDLPDDEGRSGQDC